MTNIAYLIISKENNYWRYSNKWKQNENLHNFEYFNLNNQQMQQQQLFSKKNYFKTWIFANQLRIFDAKYFLGLNKIGKRSVWFVRWNSAKTLWSLDKRIQIVRNLSPQINQLSILITISFNWLTMSINKADLNKNKQKKNRMNSNRMDGHPFAVWGKWNYNLNIFSTCNIFSFSFL